VAAEWVKAGRVNVSDPRYREFQRMQLKEPVCIMYAPNVVRLDRWLLHFLYTDIH
jgi:hypothetical protein